MDKWAAAAQAIDFLSLRYWLCSVLQFCSRSVIPDEFLTQGREGLLNLLHSISVARGVAYDSGLHSVGLDLDPPLGGGQLERDFEGEFVEVVCSAEVQAHAELVVALYWHFQEEVGFELMSPLFDTVSAGTFLYVVGAVG